MQAVFVLAVFTYEPLTYQNGAYSYPNWAHALGIGTIICTLFCVPAYAVFILSRTEGESLGKVRLSPFDPLINLMHKYSFNLQRIKSALKPNIYECKICLEHHCNHETSADFNQDSFILNSPSQNNHIELQNDKPSSSAGI